MDENENLDEKDTKCDETDVENEDKEDKEDSIENLKTENDLLKQELSDLNDRYLRLAAEYRNYQERSKKEKFNISTHALIDSVSAILPIIDDIERTLPSFAEAGEEYEKGLNMILKRISEALRRLGVESFGEKGDEFDPGIHNASSKIESDSEENAVISEVYQKGYKIKEKLVRPAMVQVKG